MMRVMLLFLATALAAACNVASAKDYSAYRVIDSVTLDLVAGPGNTAALLSRDGGKLLHIGISDICLLAQTEARAWNRVRCAKNGPDLGLHTPEDTLWSPRGDRLVMPTYAQSLQFLMDTDIRILDPQTMTVANLTDDGYDGSLFKSEKSGALDFMAHWLDDETVVFLRYPIIKGQGVGNGGPASLMTTKAGGEPAVLATLPGVERITVYTLAVSADGKQIAYGYDDRDDADKAGVYVLKVGGGAPERRATMTDVGRLPTGMAFSADGNFLLLLGPTSGSGLDARILDLATGKVTPVDSTRTVTGVAWSPTGSALAYIAADRENAGKPGGLFLTDRPGSSGRQLIRGAFMPPVCCGNLPFAWAANDTMIIGNAAKHDAPFFIRLGE